MMHCIGRPARAGRASDRAGLHYIFRCLPPSGNWYPCYSCDPGSGLPSSQHSLPKIFYRGYCEEKQLMRRHRINADYSMCSCRGVSSCTLAFCMPRYYIVAGRQVSCPRHAPDDRFCRNNYQCRHWRRYLARASSSSDVHSIPHQVQNRLNITQSFHKQHNVNSLF